MLPSACVHRPTLRPAAALLALLCACSGKTTPPPPPPPPPGDNHPPVAAFTASASSVVAGQAVGFDATTSSDPDGDALVLTWDFGDQTHGGGTTLAHVFATAGSYTATLTASDGRGGLNSTSQSITVTAGPMPGPSVAVSGFVDDGRAAVAGVSVAQVGGSVVGTTAADGTVSLMLPTGASVLLHLSKTGFADQFVPLALPTGATSGHFDAALLPRRSAVALDAAAGGSVVGQDGASLKLDPNSLVDEAGQPFGGMAQVSVSPLDIRGGGVARFPGSFSGLAPDGTSGPIATYGTTEFSLSASGQRLQLAPGHTAAIELPLYALRNLDGSDVAAGQQLPLWSLDEKSGQWVMEGAGTVAAAAGSPSGVVLRATVAHLSWWNADILTTPPTPYHPVVQCELNRGPGKPKVPTDCTIGPMPKTGSNAGQGFLNPPMFGVRTSVAAGNSTPLVTPASVDLTLFGCSLGSVFACGATLLHGAPGKTEVVIIELFEITSTSCGSPAQLTSPAAVGVVLQPQDIACYSLTVPTATTLELSVVPTGGPLQGSKTLKNAMGMVLGTASWGALTDPSPLHVALTPGTYRLEVTNATQSSGQARLLVAEVGCTSPMPLTSPSTQTVTLPMLSTACFSVSLPTAKTLTVKVEPIAGATVGNKVLKDSAGGLIVSKPWQITDTALVKGLLPGAYQLELSSTSPVSGSVTLTVSDVDLTPQTVAVPSVTTFSLAPMGSQVLSFTPVAGATYVGTVRGLGLSLSLSATGTLLRDNDALADYNSLLVTPATAAPVSFLLGADSTPAANLHFKVATAPTLDSGPAQTVSVTAADDVSVKQLVYQGTAGDTVALGARVPNGLTGPFPKLRLVDPAGNELDKGSTAFRRGTDYVAVTLPSTGAYRVDVGSQGDIASVTTRVASLPAPQLLSLASQPATATGTLAQLADAAGYSVDLLKGDLIAVEVDTSGTPLLTPVVYVRQPVASGSPYRGAAFSGVAPNFPLTLTPLAGNYSSLAVGVPADGRYLLHLVGGGTASVFGLPGATGAYTFKVHQPPPHPLAVDTTDTSPVPTFGFTRYDITVTTAGDYKLCSAGVGGAIIMNLFDANGLPQTELSAGGTTYTYHLTPGAYRWALHSGAPSSATSVWRPASAPIAAPCN